MITSKQRAKLRAMGHDLDTIFQIGKIGITEETCKQIANALEARAASILAEVVECDVVSCVGTRFILYKESTKKKRIEI